MSRPGHVVVKERQTSYRDIETAATAQNMTRGSCECGWAGPWRTSWSHAREVSDDIRTHLEQEAAA